MTKPDTSTETVNALLDGVTQGPWGCMDYATDDQHPAWYIVPPDAVGTIAKVNQHFDDDARFIAAARELVPALLAERDTLRAEVERLRAGPKVKPLEWKCYRDPRDTSEARTKIGTWTVWEINGSSYCHGPDDTCGRPCGESLDAAKAAAQADYEARITSAITARTAIAELTGEKDE